MKKFFTIIFLSLFLFSCGEKETKVKNDYNPEEWDCVFDKTLMYSKRKNGYEIGGAQKGCSCAEIELLDLKLFGKLSPKFETDFGCKKSKISEIYKSNNKASEKDSCEAEIEDAIYETEERMRKMYEAIDYADKQIQEKQKKSQIPTNLSLGILNHDTNLRETPGINGKKIRILKKGEKIYYLFDNKIKVGGNYWTEVITEKEEKGYMITETIDFIENISLPNQ